LVAPAKAIDENGVVLVPKSYDQSVAVAFVGVMLAMYGAAKSVIAAALRRKFWNAIVFFLARVCVNAVAFIKLGCRLKLVTDRLVESPKHTIPVTIK